MASVFKRKGKGNYMIAWVDHAGRRREKSSRTTDKRAADRIAKNLDAQAALRRGGVIDPQLDAISDESQRTIESHLADYKAKMNASDRDDKYIRMTLGYIRSIAKHAEWVIASDINADTSNHYAGHLRDKGRSARTIQAHLTAIKGFTHWLVANHKLVRDPLASVNKPNPKADRRRERRMLLQEEWQWLSPATFNGELQFDIPGPERELLYCVAIQTGLRAGELRSITKARLFLDVDPPFITCKAGSTKSRKAARQYIDNVLADRLKEHVRTKTTQAPVFAMPSEDQLASMLRADLAIARKAWLESAKHDPDEYEKRMKSDFLMDINHDRQHLDFHSLRHTCGSWLALVGAHPKEIQAVMRHSSISITMDTYGHLIPGQEADTVARLSQVMRDRPATKRATGTMGATSDPPHIPQRVVRESVQHGATACDHCDIDDDSQNEHKTLQIATDSEPVRDDAKNGGGWIRTSGGISQQIYSLPRLATSVHPRQERRHKRPSHLGVQGTMLPRAEIQNKLIV
tara:strand:+ start:1189 stop:2739 length:1551 start_codon:yes stop_codon:yes gene_type:complete